MLLLRPDADAYSPDGATVVSADDTAATTSFFIGPFLRTNAKERVVSGYETS
jgi:hypothetical protein